MARRAARKVVGIRGAAPPLPQPDGEVVEQLRDLLREAEDGNLVGLVYGTVDPFGHLAGGSCGNASAHGMMNAATICYHRVLRRFLPE